MTKLLSGVTSLVFSLAIWAQANAPTGSISGRITVREQPLPGITVTLEAPTSENSATPRKAFSTKTDSDGRYRFTGVPKGQHVVAPRAGAYVVPLGGMMMRAGKDVTIGENEQLEGVDFALTKGGVITGKVADANGRPLIQQRVNVKRVDGNARPQPFFPPAAAQYDTDDRGVFRLYGLAAGRYVVSVGEASNDGSIRIGRVGGYLPLTYYPGTRDEAEAKVVEVTEGGEATDIDIKVGKSEKTYDAKGRIVDGTTGAPLAGVRFSHGAISERGSSFGAGEERTNTQGEFLLQGLKPGQYTVTLLPEEGSDYYSDPASFAVLTADVEGLEVKAYRGATISGIVVIEGTADPAILQRVKDVQVSASPVSPSRSQMMMMPMFARPTTNADGTFQLTGLRPGKTRVGVTPRPPLQLLRLERDGVEIAREMELTAGESVTGVKAVLGYGGGVIHGQLDVIGGTLPPETRFIVVGSKRDGSNAPVLGPNGNIQVDSRGRFVIEGLLPGEYELQLIPVGSLGAPPPQGLRVERQQVVVGAGETRVTFTLNLGEK
ncbi:MAG: carboxypeptidase regulatory-like domain-containing protein [Blastocatellia bacterium]